MEIPKGYKHTEVGIIPQDWQAAPLSIIGEVKMCKRVMKYQTSETGDVPFYKIGTFGKEPDAFISRQLFEEFKSKYNYPGKGTILLSAAGTIGRTVRFDGKDAYFQDSNIVWIDNDETKVLNDYLFYCYTNVDWQTEDGGIVTRLYNGNLRATNISFPKSLVEQRLIVAAISEIDELITELGKQIEKKRQIKEGAMYQLLTGKKRLKEFANSANFKITEVGEIPEDWDVASIDKLCSLKARIGWQGLTTEEYLSEGDYLLITGTDFLDGYIAWQNCFFVSKWRYEQDRNIQIKEGDVLITKDGTIGKVAFILNIPKPGTLNSGVFVVRPKRDDIIIKPFLSWLFKSIWFKKFIDQLTAGSTINHLYQKDFVNFKLVFPKNLKEQSVIASFLSSMDEEISVLEAERDKYTLIKQGMMQELLTGKIRLI